MRRLLSRISIAIALFLSAALLSPALIGCSDSGVGGQLKDNQLPTVWLSGAPPEGTTSRYTVHMYWGGWDPDGEISHYEYAITNNVGNKFDPADTVGAWQPVASHDSVFTFSADILADTNTTDVVSEFVRSHTFFIRAIDRQGARSLAPAYRSFTARTLSPEVNIQIPRQAGLNPALVPPITTFRWTARDYIDDLDSVQNPDSIQHIILPAPNGYQEGIERLRDDPAVEKMWEPWRSYNAPGDSGKFYISPPLEEGAYLFAVRAKDEAGAVTPVLDESRNLRRLRVSRRSSGPVLHVTNQFLGTVTTSVCNTPVVIMDLPAGVPVDFCWSANAEDYGGLVSGYRYGWDIVDVDDPDQWETDFTPFTADEACSPPRTFFFGSHTFSVEVLDNSGFCSRVEVKVNVVQFTFNRSLVLIDDYLPDENPSAGWQGIGKGIVPNDNEHDSFWNQMLERVSGFDPDIDVISVGRGDEIPLTRIAEYKTIVWSVFSDRNTIEVTNLPLIYDYVQYRQKHPTGGGGTAGKRKPNLLALFMAAGGHVLITGQHPVSNVINRSFASGVKYPFIMLYELEGDQEGTPDIQARLGDQSYSFNDLCVDVLDFSLLPPNQRRTSDLNCPLTGLRGVNENYLRDHTMREAYPLDPNFPLLELRPEAAAAGKAYYVESRGVDAEVYNPQYFFDQCEWTPLGPRDCFQPIYGLECLDTGEPTYRQPIAFWTNTYGDRVAENVDDAVAARSIVFGFPLVFFKPEQVQEALDYVFFVEWQLIESVGQ